MASYYFVGTLLPELRLGQKPEISFEEFNFFLQQNLSHADFQKCLALRELVDLENLHRFWMKNEIDPALMNSQGSIEPFRFKELFISQEGLPSWIKLYLDEYETDQERLKYFPKLFSQFFQFQSEERQGFLKNYFVFERNLKLILAAFRAKKLHLSLLKELEFENPEDPLIKEIIVQKDTKTFAPPEEFEDLVPIFEAHADNPNLLNEQILNYRFNKLTELAKDDPFSMDRILAYLAKLWLVQQSLTDKDNGKTILKDYAS